MPESESLSTQEWERLAHSRGVYIVERALPGIARRDGLLATLLRIVIFAQEAMPETLYAAFDEREVAETIARTQELLAVEEAKQP